MLAAAPATDPSAALVAESFAFADDFSALQAQLGDLMGIPLEAEHQDSSSDATACVQEQLTSAGLAYVACDSGLPSFVASPDGQYHWAWLGDRLAAWIGSAIDPPDSALATNLPVCVGPAPTRSTACPLRADTPVAGFLPTPGSTDTYVFSVNDATDYTIDLSNLPADYDLYLADDNGTLLSQSVQEGVVPERIEESLQAGTYYVYVSVDPDREADPTSPYTLRLSYGAS
jgi:hypothetical protein